MPADSAFPCYEMGTASHSYQPDRLQQDGASLYGYQSFFQEIAYQDYVVFSTPPLEGDTQLHTRVEREEGTRQLSKRPYAIPSRYPNIDIPPATSTTGLSCPVYATDTGPGAYSPLSMANAANMMRGIPVVSPFETQVGSNSTTTCLSSPFSIQSKPPPPEEHNTMQQPKQTARKPRYDSAQIIRERSSSSAQVQSSSSGRRRRCENVEPGSSRAIHLEKSRMTASKCRSKQRLEQGDLVELARDAEHRNRMLKGQVEKLQCDLWDTIEKAGMHKDCKDGRIRHYLQSRADRLACGGSGTLHVLPSSTFLSSSASDMPPPAV